GGWPIWGDIPSQARAGRIPGRWSETLQLLEVMQLAGGAQVGADGRVTVVATRPMMHRTTPAVAMPFRGPLRLLMPSTKPVIAVGNPMIGRNQAIRLNRPRH